jgi:hypothetical protein
MDIMRNIPYLILVIIGAVVLIGGIGYISISQSINGHTSTHHWESGRWFRLGLAVLVVIAFIALLLVALVNL